MGGSAFFFVSYLARGASTFLATSFFLGGWALAGVFFAGVFGAGAAFLVGLAAATSFFFSTDLDYEGFFLAAFSASLRFSFSSRFFGASSFF